MGNLITANNLNRKGYLDIVKGIAISFVVIGHTTHVEFARTYLLHACLPLFFFVSGILCKPEKYNNLKYFLVNRAKTLLIPYIFFYLFTFCYWLFIERNFRGSEVSPWSQIIGLFYGTIGDNMIFNGALWFLPCLFVTESLFFIINRLKWNLKYLIVVALVLTSILLIKNSITYLPWGLTNALFFISYYSLGYLLKSKVLGLEAWNKYILLLLSILFLIIQILWLGKENKPLLFLTMYYGQDIIYGLVSILMVFSLSMFLKQNLVFEYLGKNSLVIFALQEPIYRAVIYLYSRLLHLDVEIVRTNLLYSFSIGVTAILIITPAIWLYKKQVEPILKRILQ